VLAYIKVDPDTVELQTASPAASASESRDNAR
jgi:hypothetical protein